MDDFEKRIEKDLENAEFKKQWEASEQDYQFISSLIRARSTAGLTQEDLAKKVGVSLPEIIAIESNEGNPSVSTLKKIAEATNTNLVIQFVPRGPKCV